MSGHTTGPWHWEEGQPFITAEWNGSNHVVAKVESKTLAWHEDAICACREAGANAALLAAAPCMLEALKDFVANFASMEDGDGNPAPEIVKARAAIARAEGRS